MRELLESGAELNLNGGENVPPSSKRFETSRDLQELRRQFTAPRTPLLPSMDLFQKSTTVPEKSIVDTLPPIESMPPPASYPAEPPPARPSVVPPVRQPPSELASRNYSAPLRQSNPPPPNSGRPSSAPPPSFASEPPAARYSSNPPPPQSFSRNRVSYPVAPINLGGASAAPYAVTEPRGLSPEALRREAITIPADAHSPSQPPAFDPTKPIPSLRLPSFAPGTGPFGEPGIRAIENRRIGSVAFVLLVGLLVVAGAITGISYAARGRNEIAKPSPQNAAAKEPTKLNFERLAPNAVIAPGAATFAIQTNDTPPAEAGVPAATTARNGRASSENTTGNGAISAARNSESVRASSPPTADPMMAESPWNNGAKPPSKSGSGLTKSKLRRTGKPAGKSKNPNLVDTETPIIPD